jgi:hypothetical protein
MVPFARRVRTIRMMGRAPTLVLCSRNAPPEKDAREQAGVLLANKTRTVKLCSFDKPSEGQSGNSFEGKTEQRGQRNGGPPQADPATSCSPLTELFVHPECISIWTSRPLH